MRALARAERPGFGEIRCKDRTPTACQTAVAVPTVCPLWTGQRTAYIRERRSGGRPRTRMLLLEWRARSTTRRCTNQPTSGLPLLASQEATSSACLAAGHSLYGRRRRLSSLSIYGVAQTPSSRSGYRCGFRTRRKRRSLTLMATRTIQLAKTSFCSFRSSALFPLGRSNALGGED